MMALKSLRLTALQLHIDKTSTYLKNINRAVEKMKEAMKIYPSTDCLILPEFFPYFKPKLTDAENIFDGHIHQALCREAKNHGVYVIGGSILEKCRRSEKVFNTTPVFGRDGRLLAAYRKTHRTEVSLLGMEMVNDFEVGPNLTTFNMGQWKVGLLTCYDQFFPEISRLYALNGCHLVIMITLWPMSKPVGGMYEPLMITRSTENQLFSVSVCQARNIRRPVVIESQSLVVDPFGQIVYKAGIDEEIFSVELNSSQIQEARRDLRIITNRRKDLYDLHCKNDSITHNEYLD